MKIYCKEFSGHTLELILKRVNKFADKQNILRILNIETVRHQGHKIRVRTWWIA